MFRLPAVLWSFGRCALGADIGGDLLGPRVVGRAAHVVAGGMTSAIERVAIATAAMSGIFSFLKIGRLPWS